MHWFFIALVPPLLWALVNIIDKFLLSKYLKVDGPGALIVFSSLAGALALPVAFFLNQNVFSVPTFSIATLILGGIFSACALYFYFLALFDEDIPSVIALLQVAPVIGFILGFFVLGEVVTLRQLLASLVIVLGAFILSIEKKPELGIKLKKKLLLTVLASSLFFALYDTLFKFVALEEEFWISIFWNNIGLLIVGLAFIVVSAQYRSQFLGLIKTNGLRILSLNLVNEILYISGSTVFAYATLLAPIGLVMTVGAYQPILVMILAATLSKFFSAQYTSDDYGEQKKTKFLAIFLIVVGSVFVYL